MNDTPNKSTLGPVGPASVVGSGTVVSPVAFVDAEVVVEPADVFLGDAVQADNPASASEHAIAAAKPAARDRTKDTPTPTITTLKHVADHQKAPSTQSPTQTESRTELRSPDLEHHRPVIVDAGHTGGAAMTSAIIGAHIGSLTESRLQDHGLPAGPPC